jgi:hypothetical protein
VPPPRRSAAVLLLLLAVGGCSNDVETSRTIDGRTVFVMNAPTCDDTDACAAAWTIDGRLYVATCREDLGAPAERRYAVAGRGTPSGTEAWTVVGHDPKELLLIPQESPCADGRNLYAVAE